MNFKIVVLAKQVPDTRNVGKDAMKEDGTVNRAALPAIFNPDDLNALEMALQVKDKIANAEVHVITMGPDRASEIIRESMFRGADCGYLFTDRRVGGSDTLATSYGLSKAVEKVQPNLVFCGLQAIDGDTAQVGPQIAEKLNLPQITYAEELVDVNPQQITIKRRLERGVETVTCSTPALITVCGSAQPCRPKNAVRMLKFKHARSKTELEKAGVTDMSLYEQRPYLNIAEWNVEAIEADSNRLGLAGSPTKVKKIDSVVLTQKESKVFENTDAGVEQLMVELIDSRIVG